MLVELLKPVGPDLGRRWMGALLLVPAAERPGVVDAVARRIVEVYGDRADDAAPRGARRR